LLIFLENGILVWWSRREIRLSYVLAASTREWVLAYRVRVLCDEGGGRLLGKHSWG